MGKIPYNVYCKKRGESVESFELWADGPRMERSGDAAPVTMDSVLIANFPSLGGVKRTLDMGSGSGIISLILLNRSKALTSYMVELVPEAAELSRRNMELNGLSDRVSILNCDLRTLNRRENGTFDLIITNPPYFDISGGRSPDTTRRTARDEGMCTLPELVSTASSLLNQGGKFCMVYPVTRMAEAFSALRDSRLEPKRLRLVQSRFNTPPSVFLLQCTKDGKPGIVPEPTLILQDDSGKDSEEIRKIYHLS